MLGYLPRTFLVCSLLITAICAEARIGESRSTIERRVTDRNQGLVIDDEALMRHYINQTKFRDAVLTIDSRGELVVHDNLDLSIGIYYKTIGGERAYESKLVQKNGKPIDNPDGWLYFVVYHKGKSVLEAYKKSGNVTNAEVNGLLSRNQGNSSWTPGKLPKEKYPDDYEPFLPHGYYRNDLEVLANSAGDTVTVFLLEIDRHLNKTKEERENEKAPDSLSGF